MPTPSTQSQIDQARTLLLAWLDCSFKTVYLDGSGSRIIMTTDPQYTLIVSTTDAIGCALSVKLREYHCPSWITKLQLNYHAYACRWVIYADYYTDVISMPNWVNTRTAQYTQLESHLIAQITLIGMAWSDIRDEVSNAHH